MALGAAPREPVPWTAATQPDATQPDAAAVAATFTVHLLLTQILFKSEISAPTIKKHGPSTSGLLKLCKELE